MKIARRTEVTLSNADWAKLNAQNQEYIEQHYPKANAGIQLMVEKAFLRGCSKTLELIAEELQIGQ